MTDPDRMVVWLREAMDVAQHDAEAATPGPWTADADEEEIHAADGTVARMRDYVRVMSNAQVEADMALIVNHGSPAAVLRRIAADRKLLDDLLAERHEVVEGDCWYTCAAATEEHDGGETCDDDRLGKPCDCGRDARVERRVRLLAEGYGWTEETT